ncbi:hypothetical protein D3C76_772660 [compost metagenome]
MTGLAGGGDADADAELPFSDERQFGELPAHPLSHLVGTLGTSLRQQAGELLAADTGEDVLAPHA